MRKIKTRAPQQAAFPLPQNQTSQYARSLIEASLDPLVTISAEGNITDVNQATIKVTGISRESLIGSDFSNYFVETEKAREVYKQVFAEGFVADYPLTIRHKTGKLTDVLYNASVYKDANGNTLGVFAAARDVTAQRQAEKLVDEQREIDLIRSEQLKQAIRVREEFLSIASHELKTPLTTLMLGSHIKKVNLSKGNLSAFLPEQLKKMFEADDKQFNRITHLIDDMLDISRIDSGKLSMNFEQFDLSNLVQDLVERSSELFAVAGCEVKFETCQSVVGTWDQFRIEQVVINLLINATRYGAGKPIWIQVNSFPDRAQIIVRDQGGGIAKENHERIFQRFERAVGSEISGLGLGLYIVTQILDAHHGSIRVESELGKGATFIVELPLLKQKG